ncbi:MAG: hypothetical protein NTV89_10950 [Proteobacteria bacterium]|nr:hypothetical protein [Pseudomonadota bacterium]
MGPGIDWYRLIPGSLGTYGIVTAMNMKIAYLPVKQKLVFFGFKQLDDAINSFYKIERKQIGDECFLNDFLCSFFLFEITDGKQQHAFVFAAEQRFKTGF